MQSSIVGLEPRRKRFKVHKRAAACVRHRLRLASTTATVRGIAGVPAVEGLLEELGQLYRVPQVHGGYINSHRLHLDQLVLSSAVSYCIIYLVLTW